jgi:F420-dependent oxidoreductase-like protein
MRIGLMIEGQEGVTWDQWRALAAAAEEHAFDSLFRSDHYLSFGAPAERGTLDAWATLSALAAVTTRIRLGTLVSPATFRHPSELAKVAATADHVSEGRIELGMGAGWFEREHRAYGFPFPPTGERFACFAEQVEIVHRLWNPDQETVSFDGRFYTLEDVPPLFRPVQRPHPPLILGGQAGPKAAALAVRWADEYNTHFKSMAECRAIRDRLLAACEVGGRDPASLRFSLMTGMLLGEDERDLEARGRRFMQLRGDTGEVGPFLDGLGEAWVVGTPDRALERLAQFADAGVERVMLQHLLHDDLDVVAMIGRDLIPPASGL